MLRRIEDPEKPSDEEAKAADRGDRSQLRDSCDRERVEAPRKDDDSGEKEPKAAAASRRQRDDEKGDAMNEVIENRGIPCRNAIIFRKPVGEGMRSESAEGDSEEQDDGGNANKGGVHGEKIGRADELSHADSGEGRVRI